MEHPLCETPAGFENAFRLAAQGGAAAPLTLR
jgi:hypothetical protein